MNDSCNSDNMWKNNSVLVLNPKNYEDAKDDGLEYIIGMIKNSF